MRPGCMSPNAGSTSRYRAACCGSRRPRNRTSSASHPKFVPGTLFLEIRARHEFPKKACLARIFLELELEADADVVGRAAELDPIDVGVEVLDLEQHEAAHEHRAAGARSRASGTAARETPAQTRAQQRTDVRAAVDVRLELDALSIPRAADADAGIRHETAVRPLEDEIREDVRRHHRELDRVRNLAAVGRAPETGVLAKSEIGRAHV